MRRAVPDVVGVGCEGADEGLVAGVEAQALALLEHLRRQGWWSGDAELSIVLCDDAFIRPLNARWRGKDAATDVLSFPLEEPGNLGDVVLSVQTAGQRTNPEWALEDELLFLLIHGLLHLLGHDHMEPVERATMEAAEQALWQSMGRVGTLRSPG